MAMVPEHGMEGLERRVLGPIEIFGQAVGNTGMATVVAFTPVLVASSAGNGSWVSTPVAVLAMLGVGYRAAIFGITLSVTALVGFESGASLGAEARDPFRAIPRVILATVGIAGVIYSLAIYIESLGFHHLGQPITSAATPVGGGELPHRARASASASSPSCWPA